MRRGWIGAAIVLFGILPAMPSSVSAEIGAWRLEDGSGDVQVQAGPQNTAASGFESLDLLHAEIGNETAQGLTFSAKLRQAHSPQNGAFFGGRILYWRFSFGNVSYWIQHHETNPRQASLFGGSRFHSLNASLDAASGLAAIQVPRSALRNEQDLSLGGGMALRNLLVEAVSANLSAGRLFDRLPDVGVGPEFRSAYVAAQQRGSLYLSTNEPLRVSNGEATTIVFRMNLANVGQEAERAVLAARNENPEWHVTLPGSVLVPAQGVARFPVILAMNASHVHGGAQTFTVIANSTRNPDEGTQLPLGVVWTTVAQPSGHHPILYLHEKSQQNQRLLWMNTHEKDPDPSAQDGPVPSSTGSQRGNDFVTSWAFPLQPSLLVGLDFDVNRTAAFQVEVTAGLAAQRASVQARLSACEPDSNRSGEYAFCAGRVARRWTLAEGASTASPLSQGQSRSFEFALAINRSADLVPYRNGTQLDLQVDLVTDSPQWLSRPTLATDTARLLLPLNEYHDPVVDRLADAGDLRLVRVSPVLRATNPGVTLRYGFDVRNEGTRELPIVLSVEGLNRDWARLEGGARFRLGAGGNRSLAVQVRAPADAAVGERADLFLVAQHAEDATLAALARFQAEVVDPETSPVPDEASSEVDPEGRSPAAPLAWLLLALGAALVLARRP